MPGYDEEQKLPTFGADGASLEHQKIVIVGDRSVGKTCLVMTYGTKQFPEN
jgi:GTPase SAR1 family protein